MNNKYANKNQDEKYFYLLIAKDELNDFDSSERRVIRRPQIKTNFVELKLCTASGVLDEKFTKKDKLAFKKASKIKINELM